MKKTWRLRSGAVVLIVLIVMLAAGCGPQSQGKIVEGKVNVVTTFYPIYEFAKAIGGEDANVINLLLKRASNPMIGRREARTSSIRRKRSCFFITAPDWKDGFRSF